MYKYTLALGEQITINLSKETGRSARYIKV
ncbi:MAG: hypothetical protein BMS9Abin31_0304 [Gammaproteobacteria bacterium]|nr:MAG: hypothetical protein BMS9Abin31_0304 [Gammaproteobacteria bacterium]